MTKKINYRLIGVTVLICLAVIFIPMLFNQQLRLKDEAAWAIPAMPHRFESIPLADESQEKNQPVDSSEVASNKSAPALHEPTAWIIQTDSFASEEAALKLRDQVRQAGFAAFVTGATHSKEAPYSVLIGPQLGRQRTEQRLRLLQKKLKTALF